MKSSKDHGSTTSRSEVAVVGRCNWGLLGLLVAVWCWRRWDWFEFEKSVEEKEERIKRRRKKEKENKKEGDGLEEKKEGWCEKKKESGGWGHVGSCLFDKIKN